MEASHQLCHHYHHYVAEGTLYWGLIFKYIYSGPEEVTGSLKHREATDEVLIRLRKMTVQMIAL